MPKYFNDIPLSESSVSLKLSDIQRRCSRLILESDADLELALEEPVVEKEEGNPYNHG